MVLTAIVAIVSIQYASATTTCDCSTTCPALGTIIDTDVMCKSYESCINLAIDATDTIWCWGSNACDFTDLTITSAGVAGSQIQCSGLSACSQATIKHPSSAISSTWCNGWRGCNAATIEIENENDVFCGGSEGCKSAIIKSGGDLYCTGHKGCQLSTIDAEAQTPPNIHCDGKQSCWGINIISADILFCDGYQSCIETDIVNVNQIRGYGYEALKDSTIDSKGFDDISITLRGYMAGDGLVITCRIGVDCQIFCDAFGCKNTTIKYCDKTDVTITGTFTGASGCEIGMFFDTYLSDSVWCPKWQKLPVFSIECATLAP